MMILFGVTVSALLMNIFKMPLMTFPGSERCGISTRRIISPINGSSGIFLQYNVRLVVKKFYEISAKRAPVVLNEGILHEIDIILIPVLR